MVAASAISVPVLPFVNASGLANVANVTCDSGVARVWNIYLGGSSQAAEGIKPGFAVVDNSSNAGSCVVNLNTFSFTISPYTRKSFKLVEDQVSLAVTVGSGAVKVTISDVDLGIPDDSSQYGASGVSGTLDRSQFDTPIVTGGAISLTPDGYSAKATSSSGNTGIVLTKTGKTYGKYYVEIDAGPTGSDAFDYVCIAGFKVAPVTNPGFYGTTFFPATPNTQATLYAAGKAGVTPTFSPTNCAGSNYKTKMAIDLDNAKLWLAPVGASLWNNTAGADPNTPSTGFDISFVLNVLKVVYIGVYFAATAAETFTINTGNSPFADNVPPNYTAGW